MQRENKLLKIFLFLAFFILLGNYIYRGIFLASLAHSIDFRHCYIGGVALVEGKNPYHMVTFLKLAAERGISPAEINLYDYSPFFMLLMAPLSFFSFPVAKLIWLALNQVFFFFSLYFLGRSLLPSRKSFLDLVLLFFLFATSGTVYASLNIGQINIFIFFLLMGAYFFYRKAQEERKSSRKREILAALFIALATMVKISPFLFSLYFLIKRRYRIFLYTVLFVLGMGLVALKIVGRETNLSYLELLPTLSYGRAPAEIYFSEVHHWLGKIPEGLYYNVAVDNQSFNSLFSRLFTPNPYTQPWKILPWASRYFPLFLSLFFLFIMLYFTLMKPTRSSLEYSLVIFTYFFSSPLGWWHGLFFLLFVEVALIYWLKERKMVYWLLGVIALSHLLIGLYYPLFLPSFTRGWKILLGFPKLYFALLLWASLLWVIKNERKIIEEKG